MARVGNLDESQQVNIYTAGLLEPLKTDVELLNPQDMETDMSLVQAYERRLAIIAEANKAPASKPGRLPPPRPTPTHATMTTSTTPPAGAAAPTPHPFKRPTADEMAERRQVSLCFNYDEPFSHGHKCKMLFEITTINDYEVEEADASLMMMIDKLQLGVQRASPMYLEGMMNGADILVLVDSGSTHNVIDINVARTIGL
jgi:hypothetical protein